MTIIHLLAEGACFIIDFATRHRTPFLVERWARDNGFRILQCERRRFMKGPFTWTSSSRQYVCRVRVRDVLDNYERSAWICCTDIGLFNDDKTEVVWESQS